MITREIDWQLRPEKLADIFHENDWTWGVDRVPDEDELRSTVRELIGHTRKPGDSAATGRLRVERDDHGTGSVYLLIGYFEETE